MKLWKFGTDDAAEVDNSEGGCAFCTFVSENFDARLDGVVFVSTERDGGTVRRCAFIRCAGMMALECALVTVDEAAAELKREAAKYS